MKLAPKLLTSRDQQLHKVGQQHSAQWRGYQRPVRPLAAADALALENMDLREKTSANIAHSTTHHKEDLRQIAMIGLIKAAIHYDPSRSPSDFTGRPNARGVLGGSG